MIKYVRMLDDAHNVTYDKVYQCDPNKEGKNMTFWDDLGGHRYIVAYNTEPCANPNIEHISDEDTVHNADDEPAAVSGSAGANWYKIDLPDLVDGQSTCQEVIEALDLDFNEGEALKSIWRKARERQGHGKPGSTPKYNAEKVAYYGDRMVIQANRRVQA